MTMMGGILVIMPNSMVGLSPGWVAIEVYPEPNPADFGAADNSIAVDSQGHVHIALSYGVSNNDNVLLHITNASGAWVSEVVDNTVDVGYYASIAVDSNDHVHIAYYAYNERGVRYATNAGGSWTNESVASRITITDGIYRADGHNGLSLDVDSLNRPHIAYSTQTNPDGTYDGRQYKLNMTVKSGGIWYFDTVDSVTGGDIYLKKALVLDSTDHAHIAYQKSEQLYYATDATGSWANVVVDPDPGNGWKTYIAEDGLGHLGISYIPLTGNLKYATNASGTWANETVAASIGIPSLLGYDPSGQPCIMAHQTSAPSGTIVLYSRNSGGTWDKTTPVGSSTTTSTNMFMMSDSRGKLHVTYVDYGNLWYATNSIPSDVSAPTISITSPSSSGSYSTTSNTVTVSGTATDDIGVTSVTWTNDRGGSGTATGTTSWSVGSIALLTGDNVITVTAHDLSGKSTSDSITVTYTPDVTDPMVSIAYPPSTVTTDVDHIAAGDIFGTASDDVDITLVTCHNNANGADATVVGTISWATSSDMPLALGSNIIVVTAFDSSGNSGTDTISVTYTVDTVAPIVTFSSPAENYATNTTSVAVFWNATDNVGVVGYQYRIDGGAWSVVSTGTSATFDSLTEGIHTVDVKAYDAKDNNATGTLNFTVDMTLPTLSIASPAEGALVNSSTVSWSGSDALSGISHYKVRADNGTWSGDLASSSYAFLNLADGPHQVQIRAFDRAGNYVDRLVNFTLDATGPALSISEPSSGFITNGTTVTVGWGASDAISGLAGYQYRIDGGAWSSQSNTTSHLFEGLANGLHNVTIRATDNLGNTADRYVAFTVDTELPVLSITGPANGTRFNVAAVTATWGATDVHSGISGYRYRLDGGGWSPVSTATGHAFTGLADGTHILDIEAVDKANNAVLVSTTFYVDTASPSLAISSPTGNSTYTTNGSAMSLSGELSDNIGVIEVTWVNSRGGSGTATMTSSGWNIEGLVLSEGVNVITVTARDASNNTATTTLTVTYTSDVVENGTSSGMDMMTIGILLVLVIVVILVAVFLVLRRKK